MWSHNSVLNGWSECLSDLHFRHQAEPRHQYISTEDRPDITMFDPNTGQNLDLDVSLAHRWSQDIIRRTSKKNGHAALPREEKKMKKMFRRACSSRICTKMCSSCDRTLWEVGHKGREFFAAFITTVSKSRSQLLMLPIGVHVCDVFEEKIFYNSTKMQCQSYP